MKVRSWSVWFWLCLLSCHLAPRGAWLARGELGTIAEQLRSSEVVFVAHALPQEIVSIEEFERSEACIKAANEAVQAALVGTVALREAEKASTAALRVVVEEVRCQEVATTVPNNQRTYAAKARARETRGEVVLRVIRQDGSIAVEVLGRETALKRELAAAEAGRRAAAYLWGKNP